jgi:hypothetical protein
MKKIAVISALFLAQVIVINVAVAQKPEVVATDKPGWHKIGSMDASLGVNSESVSVMGADQFTAIKIKVVDAPADLKIEKATIIYESNELQEISIGRQFASGEETGTYNLNRPSDDIKTITLVYTPMPNYRSEKASIEVYGLK